MNKTTVNASFRRKPKEIFARSDSRSLLKRSLISLFSVLTLGLPICALSSCHNQRDPWWNTNVFQEGTFYLASIEGKCSPLLKFDASSHFILSGYNEEQEGMELRYFVSEKAPNGLWEAFCADEDGTSTKEAKLEWSNCYFAEMPAFYHVARLEEGQWYQPVYMAGSNSLGYTKTKWETDYPGCYVNEDGTSAYGISAYFTLHQENDVLTNLKLHFTIKGVCDLTMLFSKV
jgi:hypothetical protein